MPVPPSLAARRHAVMGNAWNVGKRAQHTDCARRTGSRPFPDPGPVGHGNLQATIHTLHDIERPAKQRSVRIPGCSANRNYWPSRPAAGALVASSRAARRTARHSLASGEAGTWSRIAVPSINHVRRAILWRNRRSEPPQAAAMPLTANANDAATDGTADTSTIVERFALSRNVMTLDIQQTHAKLPILPNPKT